jgi:hydroxylamine reductase
MDTMFCYQCEQTAGGIACSGAVGVCGKTAEVALLQDELTSELIALSQAVCATATAAAPTPQTDRLLLEGLFATLTNVDFDASSLASRIAVVRETRVTLATSADAINEDSTPGTPSTPSVPSNHPTSTFATPSAPVTPTYNLDDLWQAPNEDRRSLKTLILLGVRGIAAYAYHAMVLGHTSPQISAFIYQALAAVAEPAYGTDELLPLVLKAGEVNLATMELLDKANTQAYGTPQPTTVTFTIEPGPFIVATGHDLRDLHLLLEQTANTGVNVYTHGELLPAHAYPILKEYPHLKGNFGTAWQDQQQEFDGIPAPVLFTTNCLMPPRSSYADRVYTTSVVAYPGMTHIADDKDFSAVIKKAQELGGYPTAQQRTGTNGGAQVTTGFGHDAVLGVADVVIDAVKAGAISHFFLVGGCDGAKPGRNYFGDFVQQAPKDSVILTLGCGKYRFNDLDLGTIGGLPRILDMGQCNDAYSAIKVAVALAEAFNCGVNDLPLSLVISWYEQKAVSVLLTLLYLGITNILLGPSLPAFVSPAILDFLVKTYHIAPISTPADDLKRILG